MDMFDLAGTLFGNRANPVAQGPSLTATGSVASTDGVAGVTFDGDVTPAEDVGEDVDQTVIDLPTSPDVAEGDEVIVTLVGDGPLKTPIVTANPGSGDRMAAAVSNAETLAEQAEAVASATGQHFWPDDDGVHVTEVTQDEWNDSTGSSYHSGANVLLNALGQLFRDGLNNLLALLGGSNPGVAIYDGAGNDAENVVASFSGDGMTIFNSGSKLMKVGDVGNGIYGIASYINDVLTGYIHSISGSINVHGVDATSVTGGSGFQTGLGEVYASSYNIRETLWLNGDSESSPSFERYVSSSGFTERTKTSTNIWSTPAGTVLWSGAYHMVATQTANLSHNISTCPSGVVLEWKVYSNGEVQTWGVHHQFISKSYPFGQGAILLLATSNLGTVGTKYVYVNNSYIAGNVANNQTGTKFGITYNNAYWVLTRVIAV